MALATLTIDLITRLAKLEEGLAKATKLNADAAAAIDAKWKSLGAGAKALGSAIGGAFSVAAIEQFTRATIDQIDALNDAKDATGSTIENLSALEDVARRNGGTMDVVTGILVKFNGVLKEADGKNGVSQALKAIGLDAAALKQIDPAEALRQTAVALAGFADDGNKARIVQELFGKSIKDAAPFLKDLAEQGRLNATVTTDQADAAEKFNKQLFALQTNASNAARSVISEYLPALNKLADEFKESAKSGTLLYDTFIKLSKLSFSGSLVGLTLGATNNSSAADRLQQQIVGLENVQQREPDNAQNNRRLENLRAQLTNLREIERFQMKTTGLPTAGGASGTPTPGLPDFGGGGGKTSGKKDEPLGAIRNAQNQYLVDFLKSEKAAYNQDFSVPSQPFGPDIDPETLDRRNQATADYKAILESLPINQIERLNLLQAELNQKYEDGKLSLAEYTQATDEVSAGLGRIKAAGIDVGAELQQVLGSSLRDSLSGNFDSIAERWQNMILDMVAKAAEADLMNLLTGKGLGGNTAALFSNFASFFSSLPGFASGGDHKGGFRLVGERGPELEFTGPSRIMNATQTQQVMRGGSSKAPVYNINVAAGVGKAELYEAVQRGIQVSKADARQLLKTAGGY